MIRSGFQHWLFLLAALVGTACSEASLSENQNSEVKVNPPYRSADATPKEHMDVNYPSTVIIEDESITPPQPVTGALLSCREEGAQESDDRAVRCQLVDAITLNEVDPNNLFPSFTWRHLASSEVSVFANESPGKTSVLYTVRGERAAIAAYLQGPRFSFEGEYRDGRVYRSEVRAALLNLRWALGDGKNIPVGVISVDDNELGRSYICRVENTGPYDARYGHLEDRRFSRNVNCNTSRDRSPIETPNYHVLLSDAPEKLEWVAQGEKLENLAVVTEGQQSLCRVRDTVLSRGNIQAYMPGILDLQGARCHTQAGVIDSYEILIFKRYPLLDTLGKLR